MRWNDPVIAATFFGLVNALRQASKRVKPASEDAVDVEAAEFVESCFDDMSWAWNDQLLFVLEPMFEQGFSYLELVYKKRAGDNPPKYTPDPAKSQHKDGRVGWRKWAPRPAETMADGQEWVLDDNGGIRGMWQQPDFGDDTDLRFIPISKALHFRTTVHPANNPEGLAIHRPAYLPYYYTMMMQEIEGIGVERTVAGLPVAYMGNDRSTDGDDNDYTLLKELVTNIRYDEQMGVVLPGPKMTPEGNGFLLELLAPGGRQQWDISGIIERYDKRKALAVLAQFIMLGMDNVGSYALSKHQGDLFVLAATAWLQGIGDIINRHAIPQLMGFNNFVTKNGLPELIFDTVGVPDLEGLSNYVNLLVDKQVLSPDEELERHLRQVAGLPPPRPVEVDSSSSSPEEVEKRPIDETALLIRRMSLAVEPLQEMGLTSPGEIRGLIRPLVDELKVNLGAIDEPLPGDDEMFERVVDEAKEELEKSWDDDPILAAQRYVDRLIKHEGELVSHLCPLCGHTRATKFHDHGTGATLVCTLCQSSYEPESITSYVPA
jgi:hypothetical protein